MTRYYFNVITASARIMDFEGDELADLDAAVVEATKDARELMSSAVLQGRDISQRWIEICDESGTVLMTLNFAETLRRDA